MTSAPFIVEPSLVPYTFYVHDSIDMHGKGWLNAQVIGPTPIKDDINSGMAELQIKVGQYPPSISNLGYFDLVEIFGTDGLGLGWWAYEKYTATEKETNTWILHCMPMIKEMAVVDYEANFSELTDEDGLPGRHATGFDVPVHEALDRTRHCHPGAIGSDGLPYDMQFRLRQGRGIDTLNRGIDMGGPDWWWYCDGYGITSMRPDPREHHNIDYNGDVIWIDGGVDATTTVNVQCVYGGSIKGLTYDPTTGLSYEALVPIQVIVINNNPADPYSAINIGRRVGQVWRDAGVLSVDTARKLANNILARHGKPIDTRTLRLRPNFARVIPGDKVTLTLPTETLTDYWVSSRTRPDSSGVQEITITSSIDFRERPFRARMGGFTGAATLLSSEIIPSDVLGLGGGSGGTVPFIHFEQSTAGPGSGHDVIFNQEFICDSGVGLLFRVTVQIDHNGGDWSGNHYDLAIMGNPPAFDVVQCHIGRKVSAGGSQTIILETDVPLTDGDYMIVFKTDAGTHWNDDYDVQVDIFG